jgi:superfamily II DNA/RNA helicase
MYQKRHSSASTGPSSASHAGGFRPSSGSRFGSRPGGRFGASRPSFHSGPRYGGGFNRGGHAGGRGRGGKGKGLGDYIDPSKFINKVTVTEEAVNYVPEHSFLDFSIDENLKRTIITKGYTAPTPIQDRSIPQVLKGVDLVGIANTGTGKTAAFLIPLIHKILQDRREQVMVIVPTRELAIQIEQELISFTEGMKIWAVCCVGGEPIRKQLSLLRYQYNFIIGTPGRIKDLIERKMIHLKEFQTIVLDEADRMLDMGFVNDMRTIMAGMPKERQTLFFSATLSPEIEKLISEFLKTPVRISVKTQDTSKNIEQDVVRVAGADKVDVLNDLLKQKELTKVIVFGRTKHGVEKLSKILSQRGITATSIHGNKSHSERQRSLKAFKENKVQVLVATDVAARGLDIADVSHVINYDLPATYDDYVHRIGRTGRASKKGKALTFIE